MNELYSYLQKNDLVEPKTILHLICEYLPISRVIKHLENCFFYSNLSQPTKNPTLFDFVVNNSLSGTPFPCSTLSCRLDNIDNLLTFSTLYSNSVTLANIFDYYYKYSTTNGFRFNNKAQENFFRLRLAGDVLICWRIKPAVDAKLMKFNTTLHVLCKQHERIQKQAESEIVNRLRLIRPKIIDILWKNIEVIQDTPHSVVIKGNSNYIAHGSMAIEFIRPPTILQRYSKRIPIHLPKTVCYQIGVFQKIIDNSYDSFLAQQWDPFHEKFLTYLTDQQLEIDIIESVNVSYQNPLYNKDLVRGLTHSIPFINPTDVDRILKLRSIEMEAFEKYRNAITKVINEVVTYDSQKDFEEALSDIVSPEIANLEKIFKKHLSKLYKSIVPSVALSTTIVTLGHYFNSPILLTAFQTLKQLHDVKGDIQERNERLKAELAKNDYYFLWKLKHS